MVTPKREAGRAVAVQPVARKRKLSLRRPANARLDSPYAVHPGVIALQRWIRDLTVTTGRTLGDWMVHIQSAGPGSERECRRWLQETYGLGGSSAFWLAAKVFDNRDALAEATPEGYLALAPQYVENMFGGSKSRLMPLYEQLLGAVRELGRDVQICPSKAAVSLYRRRLFARISPHSPRQLDLGLSLAEEPHTARLCLSPPGRGCDQITHYVALSKSAAIDLQVRRWLKQAYDRAL
jgi:hypothetical protein